VAAGAARRTRPSAVDAQRDDLLAEVATLYYRDRLDQEKIAGRVGVSRSTVSRMLSEALRTGVVEIRVRRPLPLVDELNRELVDAFQLRDAQVLDTQRMADAVLARVGRLAARYLDTTLSIGDVLAISWGTGVRAVAEGLEPRVDRATEVIQMLGGAGSRDPEVDGTELARRLANLFGGRCRFLNAPLIVDDERIAAALLRQRGIRETLAAAAHADIAIVGIGALVPEVSSLLRAGYLNRRSLTRMRRQGAVGDVCGHMFTLDGELVDTELTRRVISIDVAALRGIPRVVGVSAGAAKAEAVLGALRARLVNVLVTDDQTARAVLELHRR
jgi:DNA-binding transcriptional regulator LsrR (DeoR family)